MLTGREAVTECQQRRRRRWKGRLKKRKEIGRDLKGREGSDRVLEGGFGEGELMLK